MVLDDATGVPVIKVMDLSLLGHSPNDQVLTFDRFLEKLWGVICSALEEP
jgi:hypothetical protein